MAWVEGARKFSEDKYLEGGAGVGERGQGGTEFMREMLNVRIRLNPLEIRSGGKGEGGVGKSGNRTIIVVLQILPFRY